MLSGRTRISRLAPGVTVLVALIAVLAAPSVAAADHRPPKTVMSLLHSEDAQQGLLYEYIWARPVRPNICRGVTSDGIQHWGTPLRAGRRHLTARITFRTRIRPTALRIQAWKKLDQNGDPIGPGHSVQFRLSPRKRDGSIHSWRAKFRVSLQPGQHYYLDVHGRWRDSKCKITKHASWTFHLKRRPT
jgi:hypothetical protein